MKRIAILTSSRADYGIYLPLLKALNEDPFFDLHIIAFGTHLSPFHGNSIDQIINDGFEVAYRIESMLVGDSPNAIATAIALTSLKFADFWKEHQMDFDLVFCLGDRYEMFAAVTAGIPFNIPFAHLHGGETTLGAIDNIFRNTITHASKHHFVSCEAHGERVAELTGKNENMYNVGALSLDNLTTLSLLSVDEFLNRFKIDLNHPTVLVTVHPETVSYGKNEVYAEEIARTLLNLKRYQVLITLPNADTAGTVLRNRFLKLPVESENRIHCIENLGSQGYFSAMKYCSFLLGNTSSGIIEAASFGKWVINVGDRQKGRHQSQNIIDVPFDHEIILKQIKKTKQNTPYTGTNIYYQGNAAQKICTILKTQL